ncbi:MAG: hypothetical protein U0822_22500 [Anaerolineae bacterium]
MPTLIRARVVIRTLLVLLALAAVLAAGRPTFAADAPTPAAEAHTVDPTDQAPGGIDGPNPTVLEICQDRGVTFSATASGSPAPTAQWQVSADNGASFTNIVGATSTTLTFTAHLADNNKQYRVVFTNSAGSATSGAATLIVHTAAAVTTNPTNQAVSVGNQATFTAAGTGYQSVQWQVSTDKGTSFNDVPGATSTTLSFNPQFSDNGSQYRAVFISDFGCRTPTTAATLSVGEAAQGIDGPNPPLEELCENRGGTFSATAGGNPAPTAQWQLSTDNGATFNNIPGATSTTFTFTAHAADNGNQYRTVFTNPFGTATSAAAPLIVHLNPDVTTNPTNQTVAAGSQATFTAAGRGNPTVQWQVSADNGATFTDIAGATSTTLSFTAQAGDSGKQYRAVFTSTFGCGTSVTNAATLTVSIDATPPTISITSPVEGAFYLTGAPLTASYTCSDPGGSGVKTCVGTEQGGAVVNNGSPLSTATVGARAFKVTATDNAGNSVSKTVHYTVGYTIGYVSATVAPPRVNTVLALRIGASSASVKWKLSNAAGTAITAPGTVTGIAYKLNSSSASCSSFTTDPAGATAATITSTNPSYSAAQKLWAYNWLLPGRGCYTLFITLNSGQVIPLFYHIY